MNLRENVFSFLSSSLLAFLADYLGLGRFTRQTLSSVVVRHLLPPPPPAYTISYREPSTSPPESIQATPDTQEIPDSYSTDPDEEPFVYASSYSYTTWIPPDAPAHAFTQYVILGLEIVMLFCLTRLLWSLAVSLLRTRRAVQPKKTLLDLAFSELDQEIVDDATPKGLTVCLTSLLGAGNSFLRDLISLTIDCFSCLEASYPYVIGFPRRVTTDRHFYSPVDPATSHLAVAMDADEQDDQFEDNSIHSGNTSVISAVSTAVGELEDEENASSPALSPQGEHPQVLADVGIFLDGPAREDTDAFDFIVVQFDPDDPPVLFGSDHLMESSPVVHQTQNSTAITQQTDSILHVASPLELRSEPSPQSELGELFAHPRTRLTASSSPMMGDTNKTYIVLERLGSAADLASEVDVNASIVAGPSAPAGFSVSDTPLAATGPAEYTEFGGPRQIEILSSGEEDRITTTADARAGIDDAFALEEQNLIETSTSFVRYEHGSPLFAIEELSQENISPPRSPMTNLDRQALLAPSPCTDSGSPQLVTPCDLGIVLPANPDQAIAIEEVFNSATLPADFPLIGRNADVASIIDEDIDDWDWTLLNVALHDQCWIVRARPQTVVEQPAISAFEDDPFVVSSPIIPNEGGLAISPAFQIVQGDVADHQRACSDPVRQRVGECSWITADAAPYSLTPDQADIFDTVCGMYGLILPDLSVRAYYHRAGWDFIFEEEKRCLKLATKRPNDRKRRRSSLAPVPKASKLPRGYGLSRANFLGFYNAMLFTPEKTYANVSRRGVSPSPTTSPATTSVSPISVAGSFDQTRTLGRTQSMINLNRSRGGSNIAMNGVALKAQLPLPNLKTRRSFDRSTARPGLPPTIFSGREHQEVAGVGCGRSPSASPTIPHSVWVREMVQDSREGSSFKPTFSTHRRCASQSAVIGETSTSFASAHASTPPGQRGRPLRNRTRLPEHCELVSSTSTQTAQLPSAVCIARKGKGKGKEPQTSVPVVEPSTRNLLRPSALSRLTGPSAPSPAKTVCTTVKLGQKATGPLQTRLTTYPRVDDDGAVRRFEEEQGLL